MKQSAIIVAGGKGHRMNSEVPKQFLLLKGKPLLMYSIIAFYEYSPAIEIVVALPEDQMDCWTELCDKYQFRISHKNIKGGVTRFESVQNGLEIIGDNGYVAIHDGVRPLVNPNLIRQCFDHALKYGNALPVLTISESVRIIGDNSSKSIDRTGIRLCQTPQVFLCEQIRKAYHQPYRLEFTDDASVLESAGYNINLFPGDSHNIKITTSADLAIAEAILNQTESVKD